MSKFISDFDITKVKFEELHESEEYRTVTIYFIAPKDWLGNLFPEAISAEISIEYPIGQPVAKYTTVMMSPTREDEDGNSEDYDWFDIGLLPSEIEMLIDLARKEKVNVLE